MRKQYRKPQLLFEAFQLDAALATNCAIRIGHYENQCSINLSTTAEDTIDGRGEFFNYYNCQMDMNGPEVDGHDSVCYHGPVGAEIFLVS